jgi:hypothetical protein
VNKFYEVTRKQQEASYFHDKLPSCYQEADFVADVEAISAFL